MTALRKVTQESGMGKRGWHILMSHAGHTCLRRGDLSWDMYEEKPPAIWRASNRGPGKTREHKCSEAGLT